MKDTNRRLLAWLLAALMALTAIPALSEDIAETAEAVEPAEEIVETVEVEETAEPEVEDEELVEIATTAALDVSGLKRITAKGAKAAYDLGETVVVTLAADEGYTLPDRVTVTVASSAVIVAAKTGEELAELKEKGELDDKAITYNADTAVVTIPAVAGDVKLTAEAVKVEVEAAEAVEEDTVEIAAATITNQPENVKADVGETITSSVTATGATAYQWQNRKIGSTGDWANTGLTGAKTDTLTVPVIEVRYNYEWRCVVTAADGTTVTSNGARILKNVTFAITKQPESVKANIGETVTFTVEATGVASYQWQNRKIGSTGSWSNTGMTGAKTATLTVPVIAVRYDYDWRCVLTGEDGTTKETDAVRLLKNETFEITKQPESVKANIGETVKFTVEATGVTSYQWQNRPIGSTGAWSNTTLAGKDTATLTVPVIALRYDYDWRCVLTGNDGTTKETDAVQLLKAEIFEITKQPKNAAGNIGETVVFTVEATGVTKYQWQNRLIGSTGAWSNTTLAGKDTASLTVPVIELRYGYDWRCVLTGNDGTTKETDAVQIEKPEVFEITKQPETVEAEIGATVVFSVEATGVAKYQWQNRLIGSTGAWTNTTLTGKDTASLTVPVIEVRYNYDWRCVLTGKDGTTKETDSVRFERPAAFEITKQPESVQADVGETVLFTVEATGVASYQWQNRLIGSTGAWSNTGLTGAKAATLTVPVIAIRYNYEWRCVLTGNDGTTKETDVVKFSEPKFEIVDQPASVETAPGQTITLTVNATNAVSYQWQNRKIGSTGAWSNTTLTGKDTDTLTVPVNAMRFDYEWRVVVTDATGATLESESALLLHNAALVSLSERFGISINALVGFAGKTELELLGQSVEDILALNFTIGDFEWKFGEAGTGVTLAKYNGTSSNVNVDGAIWGETVLVIGESAFEGNTALTAITLPQTIEIIGRRAFANCMNLSQMN